MHTASVARTRRPAFHLAATPAQRAQVAQTVAERRAANAARDEALWAQVAANRARANTTDRAWRGLA